ncbi:MAG TPA: cation:proton antiporter [Steroidobacteraceae bacterium]|jgi:Kef-type K+ transport system membrane component KefB/nucleotide-binding universal stress UspA family protein|nr:cation:proton antiporter [Steroidobacteraceae bacterium]
MTHETSVVIFIAQIVTLLIGGRLAGELMQRVGQPPVIGQILVGVLLGPSVFGALAPAAWQALFPANLEQKAMLDAVAQLGILLLLLMTGMETDLSVFRDARRPAVSVSLCGIVLPFLCGIGLGAMLPDSMLPSPAKRAITALFLGTALAISSVKIVALVVRDLGFVRRTVGQVIIASAILDDTIGWLIVSVIFGLALRGTIEPAAVAGSVLGTVAFLTLSLTVGRRLVVNLMRWANDSLRTEMAPISVILVIAGALALLTSAIGVHLVLGAFVAGVLVGQSPMLSERTTAQLRGLIVGLFMPVFFAVAGLSTDFAALARPELLKLTALLIVLASAGKFLGAFLGGRIGGLTLAESFAVGCGMNARGSTEVIVASIGLSMGALNQRLYSAIVAMAVITTMAMPPMLRQALKGLPMSGAERERLAREELEARGFLGRLERLLVAVDASGSGQLASRLAGLVAGVRRIPTTVLHLDEEPAQSPADKAPAERTTTAARAGAAAGERAAKGAAEAAVITARSGVADASEHVVASESQKGYGLMLIGREPAYADGAFDPQIARSAARFGGAFAIAMARGEQREETAAPLRILLPVSGTHSSRQAAELAIALAQAARGSVSALYVSSEGAPTFSWRERFGYAVAPRDAARAAALHEVAEIASHYGVEVSGRIARKKQAADAILAELAAGRYDLLLMGVSPRTGERLFFGETAAAVIARARCSLLLLSGEPAMPTRVPKG